LYGNSVRLSPPLNITKANVDEAIDILDKSLSHVEQTEMGNS